MRRDFQKFRDKIPIRTSFGWTQSYSESIEIDLPDFQFHAFALLTAKALDWNPIDYTSDSLVFGLSSHRMSLRCIFSASYSDGQLVLICKSKPSGFYADRGTCHNAVELFWHAFITLYESATSQEIERASEHYRNEVEWSHYAAPTTLSSTPKVPRYSYSTISLLFVAFSLILAGIVGTVSPQGYYFEAGLIATIAGWLGYIFILKRTMKKLGVRERAHILGPILAGALSFAICFTFIVDNQSKNRNIRSDSRSAQGFYDTRLNYSSSDEQLFSRVGASDEWASTSWYMLYSTVIVFVMLFLTYPRATTILEDVRFSYIPADVVKYCLYMHSRDYSYDEIRNELLARGWEKEDWIELAIDSSRDVCVALTAMDDFTLSATT